MRDNKNIFNGFPLTERRRMIQWFEVVQDVLGMENKSLFLSVFILDRYLLANWHPNKNYSVSILYLLGITCVFIAMKYEEVYPISIEFVEKELGHYKYCKTTIRQMEIDIL